MDNSITVSDGTVSHVFGLTSINTTKSVRNSRNASTGEAHRVTVQQSTRSNITRSNLQFTFQYVDAEGVVRTMTRSVTDTFHKPTLPAAGKTAVKNFTKNFLADASLSAQFENGEL